MLATFKELIANQFEAAFCTLGVCIDRCPDSAWDAQVVNLKFCQVAFHTLFFADYYLEANAESQQTQRFHLDNPDFFRDYEELLPKRQELLYDKPSINKYLKHCRHKAATAIADETDEILRNPCGFKPKTFSRAELHVYNIRHIQHHAAQLSLRLRIDSSVDVPWIGSGWHEV